MAIYISTFTTGFDKIIKTKLSTVLSSIKILQVYDGLVCYSFKGDYKELQKIPCFNNSFLVLERFNENSLSFDLMTNLVLQRQYGNIKRIGRFRVRFSDRNRFAKVDHSVLSKIEKHICRTANMRSDRQNPQTEFWFIIRDNGIGFFAQLLFKRAATENSLNKGELRPEFSYLMCLCADLNKKDVVYDPFCGYASIPKQVAVHFPYNHLLLSDIDSKLVQKAQRMKWAKDKRITVFQNDVMNSSVEEASIDCIITDPPWGFYEKIDDIVGFYCSILTVFIRIVKPGGRILILSARKQEFLTAAKLLKLPLHMQIDTLVNGKKATVFGLTNT